MVKILEQSNGKEQSLFVITLTCVCEADVTVYEQTSDNLHTLQALIKDIKCPLYLQHDML